MRKYLMAAALLAVVGCGEKKEKSTVDSAGAAPAAMPTTVSDSAKKADSLKADSTRKADSMKVADSTAKANMGKKPVKKP